MRKLEILGLVYQRWGNTWDEQDNTKRQTKTEGVQHMYNIVTTPDVTNLTNPDAANDIQIDRRHIVAQFAYFTVHKMHAPLY